MSKPSIFSQNYSDSMKKRRRKIIVSVIVVLVIVCGGAFYISKNTSMKDVRENVKKIASSLKDQKSDDGVVKDKGEDVADKTAEAEKKDEVESEGKDTEVNEGNRRDTNEEKNEAAVNDKIGNEVPDEKNEEDKKEYIGLGGETMVTINYKIKDGKNEIISIDNNDKITWDILNNMIVVNIKESFNTYLIMSDFSIKDITKKEYVSTKKKVYTKEYVVGGYKGYVWAVEPKFLDSETIVYITNLPYINDKKINYVWRYNIKEETHTAYYYKMPNSSSKVLGGKEVVIGKVEEDKINITVDGQNFLVDSTGKVSIK